MTDGMHTSFCSSCGTRVVAGASYCASCGVALEAHQAPAPATEVRGPEPRQRQRRRRRGWLAILAALGVVLVAGGTAWGATRLTQRGSNGELFLDSARAPGEHPFTADTAVNPAPVTAPQAEQTAAATPASTATTIPTVDGSAPGLYGGTLHNASCDRDAMLAFLQSHPERARAWVGAFNADSDFRWSGGHTLQVSDIASYASELTPLTLRVDTRVTNHGYANGTATVHQSVLEAGTAVLVDKYGVPRVRCSCGNPLLPPHGVVGGRVYHQYGHPWPHYHPTTVVVIHQSQIVINTFQVTNIQNNIIFQRPAGGNVTINIQDVVTNQVAPPANLFVALPANQQPGSVRTDGSPPCAPTAVRTTASAGSAAGQASAPSPGSSPCPSATPSGSPSPSGAASRSGSGSPTATTSPSSSAPSSSGIPTSTTPSGPLLPQPLRAQPTPPSPAPASTTPLSTSPTAPSSTAPSSTAPSSTLTHSSPPLQSATRTPSLSLSTSTATPTNSTRPLQGSPLSS